MSSLRLFPFRAVNLGLPECVETKELVSTYVEHPRHVCRIFSDFSNVKDQKMNMCYVLPYFFSFYLKSILHKYVKPIVEITLSNSHPIRADKSFQPVQNILVFTINKKKASLKIKSISLLRYWIFIQWLWHKIRIVERSAAAAALDQ